MHGLMLQGSAHNSWKMKTSQFLHGHILSGHVTHWAYLGCSGSAYTAACSSSCQYPATSHSHWRGVDQHSTNLCAKEMCCTVWGKLWSHQILTNWELSRRHSYRMEGEGEPSVQAVQSHICTRWMCLLGGWTSVFSALLDGCAPGLPGQDARQWGSRSGFSLSQGPEERDRPGSTRHQSHRPSHRAFNVQPDSVGAPNLAHDDEDERGGQSSRPTPTQQTAKPMPTTPEPRPPEGQRDRGRSRSAQCYPFPRRQGPRTKIALDPAPQKSSWTAR